MPRIEKVGKIVFLGYLRKVRVIRIISIGIIVLLISQYLLGMWTNLFVVFPSEVPSVNPLDSVFTNGPYLLLSHIVNGIGLGVMSICAVIISLISRNKRLVVLSISGFASILLAGESGIEFVLGWYNDNLYSFLMSLGFIASFAIFFAMLWFSSKLVKQSNQV